MHKKSRFWSGKKRLLAVSIAAVANIDISAAMAQSAARNLEEITVTGTRIRVTDGMAEPTPVTSMTPLELMNFEPGGTVAEQLDALPQFFSTGTAQRGGNALYSDGGGSYLDMRGLGRNRTLVLLDGSRIVPADKRGTVNVDNVPTALIRSVDVVTGGASAAYGADALGGVTNFVLDRQFDGLKVSLSSGMNEFNQDGKNWNMSIAGGTDIGDRLHVIGSFEAREIDQLERNAEDLDSDWFQRWGYVTYPVGTTPRRVIKPWVAPTTMSPAGVISGTGTSLDGMTFTNDGQNVRPLIIGEQVGNVMSGGPDAIAYSDATDGPIHGNGVANRSGFFGAQYQLTDNLSLFAQGLIGRTESTDQEFRGNFAMSSLWTLTIYRDNPFIPGYISPTESVPGSVAGIMDTNGVDSFRLAKIGGYPGDMGPGSNEYAKTVFSTESYSAGFDYSFANDWNLRGSYQSGESRKRGGEYPSLRVDREALSRDAVIDPATGGIVCNVQTVNPSLEQLAASPSLDGLTSSLTGEPLFSPIGIDGSIEYCIPYNAMGTEGMNRGALDYMATPKIADSWLKQDFAELLLTGELYEGWGYGAVSFATGVTWREQSFGDRADILHSTDALGPPRNDPALGIRGIAPVLENGNPNLHFFGTINTIGGEYDVTEWFGELQIPVWESESGNQALAGNLAFRSSDYSSSGRVESWKVGLEMQVFQDLRVRATKSRDVREASFAERFDGATGGAVVDDPFNDDVRVNVSTVSGGNPKLRPEYADTNVLGFVYEPSWVEGLSFSVDWYDVSISDAVATLTFQQVVDSCFDSGALCENLIRNSEGSLSLVVAPYLNLDNAAVSGIDFEVQYSTDLNFFANQEESLRIRGIAGRLNERTNTPKDGVPTNLIGSTSRPEYTGIVTANYNVGPWGAQWQQRFIAETMLNITWEEGVDIDDNSVPFYSFTNLQLSYTGDMESGGEWRASLAVNNAFDKNPPIIPGYFDRIGAQTGGLSSFDEFGRRYQLSLNVTF